MAGEKGLMQGGARLQVAAWSGYLAGGMKAGH